LVVIAPCLAFYHICPPGSIASRGYPLALYANPDTRNVHAYLRQVGDEVLTLALDDTGQNLVNLETGRAWTVARRLDTNDPSGAQPLLSVLYISSFDWAWLDSHPDSEFYQ
jgi:hypothetical protein